MARISRKNIKDNEDAMRVADSLDVFSAIQATAKTEGGQILIRNLVSDIISSLETFANKTNSLSLQEFIDLGCSIKAQLDIVHTLTRSSKNAKMKREEMEELLKDSLED